MGDLHLLKKARKREPLPLPDSFLKVASVLGLDTHQQFRWFSLHRCKPEGEWRTEVHLHSTKGFMMNLSIAADIWPANFKEARRWVAAYADRYRLELVETRSHWPHNETATTPSKQGEQ